MNRCNAFFLLLISFLSTRVMSENSNIPNINPADIGVTLTAAGSPTVADENIPAYEGSGSQLPGWEKGKRRRDYWHYKDEQPLFVIDQSNVNDYADILSPGQQMALKNIVNYQMQVYPSHRTCSYPDFVVNNSRSNVGNATLNDDGNGIATAVLPAIPFPAARTGLEAIWNHLMRYEGVGINGAYRTAVALQPGVKSYIDPVTRTVLYRPLSGRGQHSPDENGGVYLTTYVKYLQPAAMSGQALMQKSAFDKRGESYAYFPGQRRVRRLPVYDYDAPILGFSGQLMVDASFTFNGNPDRFDWTLTGTTNLLVPYNNFDLYDSRIPEDKVITPYSVGPDVRRYELHKVWVVEANVKKGRRHSAPKRVFYLDADTYLALLADEYDDQGQLRRVRESYPMPVWELNSACTILPYAQYDLLSGRFFADMLVSGNDSGTDPEWHINSDSDKNYFSPDFYTQDNLRSISH